MKTSIWKGTDGGHVNPELWSECLTDLPSQAEHYRKEKRKKGGENV